MCDRDLPGPVITLRIVEVPQQPWLQGLPGSMPTFRRSTSSTVWRTVNHNHDASADREQNGDADTEPEMLWQELADGLGCYLSAMDAHSMHSLVIELVGPKPQPDPTVQDLYPYVIFSSRSDRLLHAEIPSNLMLHPRYALSEDACDFSRTMGWDEGEIDWYLGFPIEDAEEVVDRVVMAFRKHFRVGHPHL